MRITKLMRKEKVSVEHQHCFKYTLCDHKTYTFQVPKNIEYSVVLTTRYDTIEISFLRATLSSPRGRRQAPT